VDSQKYIIRAGRVESRQWEQGIMGGQGHEGGEQAVAAGNNGGEGQEVAVGHIVTDMMDILFFLISFVLRQSRTLNSLCYQKSISHAGEVTTVTWTSHGH
jgi:hypothetical protein